MTDPTTPGESRDSTQTAAGAARDLGDEARQTADRLKDRATEEASARGEAAKAGVADEISDLGQALRRAAEELRTGSPQERTFGHMADALADMSDTVRGKDFGEMAGDLSGFARRNPLAFLGGAALLGFAGTRLARASERHREQSVDLTSRWGSDAHDDELEAEITGRRAAPTRPVTPGTSPGTSPVGKGESR